jgi:hypothetical protein
MFIESAIESVWYKLETDEEFKYWKKKYLIKIYFFY